MLITMLSDYTFKNKAFQRNVEYEVTDDTAAALFAAGVARVATQADYNQNTFARIDPSTGFVIDGFGNFVTSVGKIAKPKIAFVGDSITEYSGYSQSMNITSSSFPFGGSAFSIISVSWANGSGTSGTLKFNKASQTLRWAAPGESEGPAIDVSRAGVYVIPSQTATKTITVVCRPRVYSTATEGDFTVSTTAATELSRRSGKTFSWWVHAKCRTAFEPFLLSNGGSIISDITESMVWQIPAGYYDAIVLESGTNDISIDRTLAQMQTDMLAQISAAKQKSQRIFVLTILPRTSSMTATRRQNIIDFNKWVMALNITGVTPVNTFARLVDPDSANADPISGVLEDGLHPTISGAELMADALAQAIIDTFQFDAAPVISAQTDVYNGSTNIAGNALPSGGTFTGSGGTFGTGASGVLGSNWNVSRDSGTNITAVCSKVARTDGFPGSFQRIVISNPGAVSERIILSMVSASRPTVATGQVWRAQGAIIPSGMVGVEMISLAIEPTPTGGAFTSSWGYNQIAGANLTGARSKFVMEPWPLPIPAGAGFVNIALRVQLAASGTCTIDFPPGEWRLWRES